MKLNLTKQHRLERLSPGVDIDSEQQRRRHAKCMPVRLTTSLKNRQVRT